ncbi:MAG: hypothetical protein AB1472_02825 [Candidatus Omnitrophota bacterium]
MKIKYLIFISLITFLILSSNLWATPSYGTDMPKKHGFFTGLEYNIIVERDLKNNNGRIKNSDKFLMLSYGIFDWLSIDLKAGAGSVTYKDSAVGDLKFRNNFAGAYGFRIKLFESKNKFLKITTAFQHISVHPKGASTPAGKYTIIVDEWFGSTLASIKLNKFVPYFGFKAGTYDVIRWIDDSNRKRFKSEDNLGLIVGFDYWLTDKLKLNFEHHFIDEIAGSFSVGINF